MPEDTQEAAGRNPKSAPTSPPQSLADVWRKIVEDLKAIRDGK